MQGLKRCVRRANSPFDKHIFYLFLGADLDGAGASRRLGVTVPPVQYYHRLFAFVTAC